MPFDLAGGISGGVTVAAAQTKTAAWTIDNTDANGLVTAVGEAPKINLIDWRPAPAARFAGATLPDATTYAEGDRIFYQVGMMGKDGLRFFDNSSGQLVAHLEGGGSVVSLTLIDNSSADGIWLVDGIGWTCHKVPMSNVSKNSIQSDFVTNTNTIYHSPWNGQGQMAIVSPTRAIITWIIGAGDLVGHSVPIVNGVLDWENRGAQTTLINETNVLSAPKIVALGSNRAIVTAWDNTGAEVYVAVVDANDLDTTLAAGTSRDFDTTDAGNAPTTAAHYYSMRLLRLDDHTAAMVWLRTNTYICEIIVGGTINDITYGTQVQLGEGTLLGQFMTHRLPNATNAFILRNVFPTGGANLEDNDSTHIFTWDDPGFTIVENGMPGSGAGPAYPVLGNIHPDLVLCGQDNYLSYFEADETGFTTESAEYFGTYGIYLGQMNTYNRPHSQYMAHDLCLSVGNRGWPGTSVHGAVISDHIRGRDLHDPSQMDHQYMRKYHQLYSEESDQNITSTAAIGPMADSDNLGGSNYTWFYRFMLDTTHDRINAQSFAIPKCKFGRIRP